MSTMKHQARTIGAGVAMLTLVGSAAAIPLQGQGGYQVVPGEGIPWPTSLGTPGNFRRIVIGEFAGDVTPGALALVGDRAVYLHEPAVHKDVTSIMASGVNDIAALAPASQGQRAGMILAATDALYIGSLNILAGSITTGSIATGNFADLDLVRSGDIDGAGLDDIVGATGANVYVLLESGSGWAAGSSFQASGPVREAVILDWDGTGQGDIAIRLDQSVEIRQSNGTLIETRNGVAPGGYLTYIPPSEEYYAERLGWSLPLPSPSTSHALVVLSYPGVGVNCGIFPQAPGSLLSAIFKDTSGTRVDLLTSRPLDTEVLVYQEQPSSPPYTAATPLPGFDVGTTAVAGDGPPAFADFTLDGIPDTIAGRGATDEFFVVAGQPPTLGTLDPEEAWGEEPVLVQAQDNPWVGITVNLPEDLGGHDHVQAILWWSTDGELLEPAAIANLGFGDLVPGGSVDVWLPLGGSSLEDVCEAEFQEGFAVSVRLVTWTPGNPISAAGSPLYGVFTNNQETADNMLPPDAPDPVAWFDIDCGGNSPGIGYTPVASLPPKRSDAPPSVPQITEGSAP